MSALNQTHDPALKSWVESANLKGAPFPIQNLPFGVFSSADCKRHIGVAISDQILDLTRLEAAGHLRAHPSQNVLDTGDLNAFMALDQSIWRTVRAEISHLLSAGVDTIREAPPLIAQADAQMHLPIFVRSFTDFYASLEHAMNVGRIFRGEAAALVPNWLHMPIGYNGRASTVVVSGTGITRPTGQLRSGPDQAPQFRPTQKLDFEVELGAIVGTGNAMGTRVSTGEAYDNIFGYVLMNDWSARDIQLWEYQPLGPFQSKAFGTTISPWVVTREALEPFRVSSPERKEKLLPHLREDQDNSLDIDIVVMLAPKGDAAKTISRVNSRALYYSSAVQLAHHASSGCAMEAGDLLGSGTISGTSQDALGCMLELTKDGKEPLAIGSQTRGFLEDGDTVTFEGACRGDYVVGFGQCAGTVLPAN